MTTTSHFIDVGFLIDQYNVLYFLRVCVCVNATTYNVHKCAENNNRIATHGALRCSYFYCFSVVDCLGCDVNVTGGCLLCSCNLSSGNDAFCPKSIGFEA